MRSTSDAALVTVFVVGGLVAKTSSVAAQSAPLAPSASAALTPSAPAATPVAAPSAPLAVAASSTVPSATSLTMPAPRATSFLAAPEGRLPVFLITDVPYVKPIQSYAGSADVFLGSELTRYGVTSVLRLSEITPFVHVGEQEGNVEIYTRGIGSDNNTELGDPATATYLDGIYLPRPRSVGLRFFDLERVEVHRGPQGTVRGRNATAGTVNIVTAKPDLSASFGEASVQLGNYWQVLTRGVVNLPLAESLAVRIATFTEHHEPFYKDAASSNPHSASESAATLAYRFGLKWLPAQWLTLSLGHDYTREGGTGVGGTNFSNAINAGLLPREVEDPRSVVFRGTQGQLNSSHFGVHGEIGIDRGDVLVQWLGSYRKLDYNQTTPGCDGVAFRGNTPEFDNWSRSDWQVESESLVQELRFYSPEKNRFRWTFGGFLFQETQHVFLGMVSDRTKGFGGEFLMPQVSGASYAEYLDATVKMTSDLRLTAGIRVTTESKDRIGSGYTFSGSDSTGRFGTEGFRWKGLDRGNPPAGPTILQDEVARWGENDTVDYSQMATYKPGEGRHSDNFVDARAVLEHTLRNGSLVYTILSTGHHSGGFNDKIDPQRCPSCKPSYRPESLFAVEMGIKNQLFDQQVILNAALFGYRYTDMQFQRIEAEGTPAAGSAVRANSPNGAHIVGAELTTRYRLPYGFSASLDAFFLDAKFDCGSGIRPYGEFDVGGNWLPKASQATINYSVGQDFTTPLGEFDWFVSAQTRGKYYLTIFNGKPYKEGPSGTGQAIIPDYDEVPTYTRINAGIGYAARQFRLDAFVNNVTDVAYPTSLISSTTDIVHIRFYNPPRQFGLRATVYL